MLRYFIVLFFIFSLFAISRKKYIFAVVKNLNLNDMKKIFLGLLAIVGIVFFFTACGDDNNTGTPEQASATESGKSLYDSYKEYSAIEGTTTEDNIKKTSAALSLYNSYNAYNKNKEDSEWVKEFATSAVYAIGEDKKEEAKTNLIAKLSSETGVTGSTVEGVATLVEGLSTIFGN